MNTKTGTFAVPRDEYDRMSDRVNWSTLKHMGRSPAHYREALVAGGGEDTDARKRGRVTHLAVFEPERFRAECVVWNDGARRGKAWEAFVDRNPDKEILTEGMYEDAIAASKAARASAMAAPYLSGGKGEVTVLWTHVVPELAALKGYEIQCKGRVDFLQAGAIVDLKTCRDASPEAFGKQCAQLESYAQAAFYVDGIKAATGKELPYVLVAVEAAAPFCVQVYRVPDEILRFGRDRYRALLDRLNECKEMSNWPGYADGPVDLTLPKWMAPKDSEDVADLGLTFGEAA